MLSLAATFENSQGGLHRLNLKDPDRNKPAEEIRAGLEKLVQLNLFEKGEVGLFKKLVCAKFVETIERPIFDLRQKNCRAAASDAEVQPETAQATQTSVSVAPVKKDLIPLNSVQALQSESVAPIAPTALEVPQIEIKIPEDFDASALTEDELLAMLTAQLPAGATLESFKTADIVFNIEGSEDKFPKTDLTEILTGVPQQAAAEKAVEPVTEKRVDWVPKPKSKFRHLLSGLPWDKRKRKKTLKQFKKGTQKRIAD